MGHFETAATKKTEAGRVISDASLNLFLWDV